MTMPTYLECIRPILELVSDGKEHTNKQAIEFVTSFFKLTDQEQSRLIPSGGRPLIDDRVLWALLYIRKGEFVEYTDRGIFQITSDGKSLLSKLKKNMISPLSLKTLREQSEALNVWYKTKGNSTKSGQNGEPTLKRETTSDVTSDEEESEDDTPSEKLAKAYEELKEKTISELVEQMKNLDDKPFEIFIANLLPRLGYGKDANDIIRAHGGSGDGGIDGIVQLDSLGAQRIYIQAKHWQQPVGMKPVAEFIDKVDETKVSAGLFVALSGFNKEATGHIYKHRHKIAWIDAYKLAEVMIRRGVGVIQDNVYRTYRVDDEYFDIDSV